MGLFNFFKKPLIIRDDVFGELRFINGKQPYFEGSAYFAATGATINVFIPTQLPGPSEEQKIFYTRLQQNFTPYIEKINPLIEDEFRNWKPGFAIGDFNAEFTLLCISIPNMNNHPLIWDMAFSTVHDRNHQISIDFEDHHPAAILIDG
jgi:hypothetical protein